ncbi:MAG: glycosyltransferase [Clostridium beijerinckii]
MNRIILVNATSATIGGSLTILNQFIENLDSNLDKNKKYYIFVPVTSNFKSSNNVVIVPIKAKKYFDRIKWDLYGIRKWCRTRNIKPNLIVSLQNTASLFGNVPQIIYLHQPLPYAKESSWSLLKRDERKLWFYKYVYKIWINCTIKKSHYIIVQTKWMKDSVIKSGYSKKRIIVCKPEINNIEIDNIQCVDKGNKKFLFYPAADYKYKNHNVIIEAVKELSISNDECIKDLRIFFTLNKNSRIYDKIVNYGLEENIKFLGTLKYEEVLSYYKSSDVILFPSYIETFGLPLIEASCFGKKILVSNCNYAKEVLNGYSIVNYIKYDDVSAWRQAIVESMEAYKEKPNICSNNDGWKQIFNLIEKLL